MDGFHHAGFHKSSSAPRLPEEFHDSEIQVLHPYLTRMGQPGHQTKKNPAKTEGVGGDAAFGFHQVTLPGENVSAMTSGGMKTLAATGTRYAFSGHC